MKASRHHLFIILIWLEYPILTTHGLGYGCLQVWSGVLLAVPSLSFGRLRCLRSCKMDRINKLFRALAAVVEEMQPLVSVVFTFGTEACSMISTSIVVRGRAWVASRSRSLSRKLRCSGALFRHRGSWMICHPLASRHRYSISTLLFCLYWG